MNFTKKLFGLLIGTCFISFGIAISSKAAIGMSPISSFPYVMSLLLPVCSLGTWVFLWNVLFALLQIPVMGRQYKLYLLLQIPLAILLGYVTDFTKYLISPLSVSVYPARLLFQIFGVACSGFGVFLTVRSNLLMNGPEAFLHSIADRFGLSFGFLKSVFDISNMLLAVVVSFLAFHRIEGVREGTVIAALFTGAFVNLFHRLLPENH